MPPPPAALSVIWKRMLHGEITSAIPAWYTFPCHHMHRKAVAIRSMDHLPLLSELQLGETGFLLPSHNTGIQA